MPREGNRGKEACAIAYELHDQPLWSSRMLNPVNAARSIFLVVFVAGVASEAKAQSPPGAWLWNVNGNVFAGVNHQNRKAADLTDAESQNWLMATGERPLGRARLRVHTMLSFEPFTLKEIGSAQVFQTGERDHGARNSRARASTSRNLWSLET